MKNNRKQKQKGRGFLRRDNLEHLRLMLTILTTCRRREERVVIRGNTTGRRPTEEWKEAKMFKMAQDNRQTYVGQADG